MKLLVNREVTEQIPLFRIKPRKDILLDRLYGFNVDIGAKLEFNPVYKPLIVISKTTNHIRFEMFGRRIYLKAKRPLFHMEKI